MDQQIINLILGQVRKRMRTFEVSGCRQSRRVSGLCDRDDELHGFKNLCIYIDTALTGREGVISQLLGHIDSFLYGREHYNHTRWPMFFGSSPERLVGFRPSAAHGAIRAADWRGVVIRGITENAAVGDACIPRLHNPGSSLTRFPDSHDLALFFCRGRDIRTAEEQQKGFTAIRQRSLWFFFGDGELPELEAGGFVPGVSYTGRAGGLLQTYN